MRIATTLLALAPLWAQTALRPATVGVPEKAGALQMYTDIEKRMEGKLMVVDRNDPVVILGLPRGIYLQGYGAVFTVDLSLVAAPAISPFNQQITKQQVVQTHDRKVKHVPVLKTAMRDLWMDTANSLASVPDTEQVVVAVRLLYQSWEDTTGLPAQIILKAPRKAGLAGNIQVEEQ